MAKAPRKTASLRERLLSRILPWHGKRILFIVTLYNMMKSDKACTPEELEELNRRLELAKTSSAALVFPMSITHKPSWSDVAQKLTTCDEAALQEEIAKLPSWLKYGRASDIVADITKLRSVCKRA